MRHDESVAERDPAVRERKNVAAESHLDVAREAPRKPGNQQKHAEQRGRVDTFLREMMGSGN